LCFGKISVWSHCDQLLRCGAALASWELSACSRWDFGPLEFALGLWPRPTINNQRFADPASESACGSVVVNGGFIVITNVLRHLPMGPVARKCPVISHMPAVIISASSAFPGPWTCPCPIYPSPLHDYFTIFFSMSLSAYWGSTTFPQKLQRPPTPYRIQELWGEAIERQAQMCVVGKGVTVGRGDVPP
jgi:hypothetical protein